MESKKIIAVFDFDGTITTKDTLFDFISFYHSKGKLIRGLCFLSPVLIAYKAGLLKNDIAKQKLLSYFFKNEGTDQFESICKTYIERISRICKEDTLNRIKWHKQQGHTLVIVSASMRNWIEPWALDFGFDKVIGTELEITNNLLTGRFASKNCYGQEKVNRLLEVFPNRNSYVLYAYGDSNGDKQLLELSDYPTLIK